jgi:hypothetical protein
MEVYILDDQLRRIAVIDRFESMIWTERYAAYGDFQLVIHSTLESRGLLVMDTWISITSSTRVMMIENVVNKDDSEGHSLLTITGRSIEAIFLARANRKTIDPASPASALIMTGTPGNIVRDLFTNFCGNNTGVPADNIPFYTLGTLYGVDTIAEPDIVYTIEFGKEQLYDSMKSVLDTFNLGFRLYKGPDTTKIYFNVYTGSDRTSTQTSLPAVIFSPDLENLTNISELTAKENFKNIAYVFGLNGSRIVYSESASSTTVGFNRRVLVVDAQDIDLPIGTALDNALQQKGLEELAKNKSLYALDGELPTNSKYKYEVHYFLGDLIEMRSDDGLTNNMRVTEQIFVDDAEGERSYPTLAIDTLIVPGSWLAWDYNEYWDNATAYWDTA